MNQGLKKWHECCITLGMNTAITSHPAAAHTGPALNLAELLGADAWAQLSPAIQRRFAAGHGPARYVGQMQLRYSPLVRIEAVERLVRRKAERAGKPSGVTEDFAEAAELVSGFLSAVEAREMHITTGMGEEAVRVLAVYGAAAGHPAQLDLAGALTYACAKAYHIPVLASDDRFKATDIA